MTAATAPIALVFPGQGAQAPGMGAAAVAAGAAPELLTAATALGLDLAALVRDADQESLRRTDHAQPALFFCSWAVATVLLQSGVRPKGVAGHSVGEWVAVAAADALDPVAALELVVQRGRLMAEAPPGTMAAVLGAEAETVAAACRAATDAGEVCVIANDNAPGQLVISGTLAGVERAGRAIRQGGGGRVVPLRVGGAFHSPLMRDAARAFAERAGEVSLREPRVPLAANATGTCLATAAELGQALAVQLECPVRWADDVRQLAAAGVTTFVECGPGTTLSGMIRRTVPGATIHAAATPEEAAALARRL